MIKAKTNKQTNRDCVQLFLINCSKRSRNLFEVDCNNSCVAWKRSSSFSVSVSRKSSTLLVLFFLGGGGPEEVQGVSLFKLPVPDGAEVVESSSLSSTDADGDKPGSLDTAELPVTSASHESIRMGGSIDGLLPIASCIAENHGHVAAVASPLSVPVPVGGQRSS